MKFRIKYSGGSPTIDWGDEVVTTVTTTFTSHTYEEHGEYTIKIYDYVTDIKSFDEIYTAMMKSVTTFGDLPLKGLTDTFRYANNLEFVPSDLPSSVTSLIRTFSDTNASNDAFSNIVNWDVSNVTDMSLLFSSARISIDF
ncbi:MAG: BspA family leucine-rich repeat surface protein [Acholeplasma sp.]|nr:BspA family leucine-rich repeat surface protein [Acholeplasma sp.]